MSERLAEKPENRNKFKAAVAASVLLLSSAGCEAPSQKPNNEETVQIELKLSPAQQQKLDDTATQIAIDTARDIREELQYRKKKGVAESDWLYGSFADINKNRMLLLETRGEYKTAIQRGVSDTGAGRLVVVQGDAGPCDQLQSRMVIENKEETLDDLRANSIRSFLEDDGTHVVRAAIACGPVAVVAEGAVLSGRELDYEGDSTAVPADKLVKFALDTIDYIG